MRGLEILLIILLSFSSESLFSQSMGGGLCNNIWGNYDCSDWVKAKDCLDNLVEISPDLNNDTETMYWYGRVTICQFEDSLSIIEFKDSLLIKGLNYYYKCIIYGVEENNSNYNKEVIDARNLELIKGSMLSYKCKRKYKLIKKQCIKIRKYISVSSLQSPDKIKYYRIIDRIIDIDSEDL